MEPASLPLAARGARIKPELDEPLVLGLQEVDAGSVSLVGGKNAALGELLRALGQAGVRVPPGAAYDTLNTDEGYTSWGYCAPYWGVVSAPIKEHPMFLTVNFVDDDGRAGSVRAQAIWKYRNV